MISRIEAIHGAFKVTRRVGVLIVAEWLRAPMCVPPIHDFRGLKFAIATTIAGYLRGGVYGHARQAVR
jgi:hypothetical protein